jgi:hypothetical protein
MKMTKNELRLSARLIADPKTSSGICTFDITCEGEMPPDVALYVEISQSGYDSQIFSASNNKIIGIHTHLLPPGNFLISFKIVRAAQVLAKVDEQFSLDIRNGLYQITRDAQLQNETPLFLKAVLTPPCILMRQINRLFLGLRGLMQISIFNLC